MGGIRVVGLVDLNRELRKVSRDLPVGLKEANYRVAKHITDRAELKAKTLGPGFERAARSLSASRSGRAAQVGLGGARAPDAGGWEFGAQHNQVHNTTRGLMIGWNQFPVWRGNQDRAGYFLYPTIRAEAAEVLEMYAQMIDQLVARAFPDRVAA